MNKAWLTIGIFALISRVLFAYLAYRQFPGFVSFTYANTSPWGNTGLFAASHNVIAVGAAIIFYSVRPYNPRPPPLQPS